MSHAPAAAGEVSLTPPGAWHCSHLYYRFDRAALKSLTQAELAAGREAFQAALDPGHAEAPARLQTSVVSGHKADFGLMLLDGDPLKIDAVHQRLVAGPLGVAADELAIAPVGRDGVVVWLWDQTRRVRRDVVGG